MIRPMHVVVLCLILATAGSVLANGGHPNHISLAEVEYNPKTGELEVSLALQAIDFEETLSRRMGKRINLDRSKGIKKMIEDYLAERFVITLPDGTRPHPEYLGREDKGKVVWLYFSMPFNQKKPKPSPVGKSAAKNPAILSLPASLKDGDRHPVAKRKAPESRMAGVKLQNCILMELNAVQYNRVILREGKWRRNLLFERSNKTQVLRKKVPIKRKKTGKQTSAGHTRTEAKTPIQKKQSRSVQSSSKS